jgi:polysaccharide pyruvyl transferase WcaK-like protein
VVTDPPPQLEDVWTDVTGQTAPDWELILVGCDESHQPMAGLLQGDPRVSLVDTLEAALAHARGELVVTVDGAVAVDHRFLARVVKHFHDRPSTSSLTVGYTLPTDPPQVFRTEADAAWVDANWAASVNRKPTEGRESVHRRALPLVTVARRRDWAKAAHLEPAQGWSAIRQLDRPDHLDQGLVWVPEAGSAVPRPDGFVANRPTRAEMVKDLRSRPRHAARTGAKILRARYQGLPYSIPTATRIEREEAESEAPVHARYVGWVGYDNLGDEAMLEAFRRLLPWATVEVSGTPRELLLLGGGTLINRSTYLGWLTERDSPRIERAVVGTGVANPAYWGVTEQTEDWVRWLSSCVYVGVRGPHSETTLRDWGYEGPLEVCGDSALLFERPPAAQAEEGLVVVSPAWTGDELWGGSDDSVMKTLAEAVRGWLGDGREVRFLSCNPADDRPIFETMRAAGHPDLPYLAGYRDLDATLHLLASAELVVGERLHAAVLAAAVGTPFVAVEYRPKLGDFAASVGAESALVRTDHLTPETLAEAAANAAVVRNEVAEQVTTCRARLRTAAETIHAGVRG